ncbi:MAG TPA: transcriptional regulator [Chloroflexi bacterium]|jgi:excisionase family DNA binding protein|nr:transcriptional regulator [Chloroflexota bacterium]HAL28095.1 transcriptional regulator [Chloroflexota bacterium]
MTERLLTIPEAARRLGIGTTLEYEKVGRGELPHVRLGHAVRVLRQALEARIDKDTVGPRETGTRT